MTTKTTLTIIALTIITYTMIWSIGCSPMAVLAHETLGRAGIDSQIVLADVDGKESFGHAYVMIGDQPVEPRYLGLYLQGNINYDNPYEVYDSTDDYVGAGYTVFPAIGTIIGAVVESV